jgi:hypothetical protein
MKNDPLVYFDNVSNFRLQRRRAKAPSVILIERVHSSGRRHKFDETTFYSCMGQGV